MLTSHRNLESRMIKYTLTVVVVLLGLTWPSFIWSEDQPLEVQIVDALHKALARIPASAPTMLKA